jgi:hypothetical protein
VKDITDAMLRFKEAVRHIWNTYLYEAGCEAGSLISHELWDSFKKIERELFRTLVLLPNGAPALVDSYRRTPMPILLRARDTITDIPVQFGSVDVNRNTRWELPCLVPAADFAKYQFIEFFDWYPYGPIDLAYVKARSNDGQLALIEQMYCNFVFDSNITSILRNQ